MMYVLSGKGSVAGVDLAACILANCQQRGVLWDSDLPEYTLDFATQVPSVSKSIREGRAEDIIRLFDSKLQLAESAHTEYMLLCLTAHKLIPQLQTRMTCINLWDCANPALNSASGPVAFLGTLESAPQDDQRLILLKDQIESIGDLITSVKRGYALLGESFAAHPKHLLKRIVERFQLAGATTFFIGCTDLHACKQYLMDIGIPSANIISIIDIAAAAIIERCGRKYSIAFLDDASDARTHLRYKYVERSDAPETEDKTRYLNRIIDTLPRSTAPNLRILDIGGSSSGHSLRLARQLTDQPCHITLLDISEASLDAARHIYAAARGVTTTFVHGNVESFFPKHTYDAILCIGVLLYVSDDEVFRTTVRNIANLMEPGAILLTRDCLTTENHKVYMAFGGVIRNHLTYDKTFEEAGMKSISRNKFVIHHPIERTIVTTLWRKSE